MDLTFSDAQEAFRAEARAWLEAHVPAEPLASFDTAEGFEAHRRWEREMFDDRWSVVSWPVEYGGRDVGIFEWLVFEEEYYRSQAPTRVSQNGIFRSEPEAERHRGLTYFLVAMDTPGVTVRPIPQIDGETGFAEIFFDDVEVPEDQVLGEVGAGWSVAMATAGSERGLSLRSPARYTEAAERLVQLYATRGRPAASADAVARAHMHAEAYELHTYWTASRVARGHAVGAEASANKIFWSETDLAIHTAALDLLGPEAELLTAGAPGEWLDGYLFSLAGPIYAGTNEIQRNVVAERLLGLPRG